MGYDTFSRLLMQQAPAAAVSPPDPLELLRRKAGVDSWPPNTRKQFGAGDVQLLESLGLHPRETLPEMIAPPMYEPESRMNPPKLSMPGAAAVPDFQQQLVQHAGRAPMRPSMPTRPEKGKYSILAEALGGLGDVASAAGGRRTDYLGGIQATGEAQRNQAYQDSLARAADAFERDKAGWQSKLMELQLGQQGADRAAGRAAQERQYGLQERGLGQAQQRIDLDRESHAFDQNLMLKIERERKEKEDARAGAMGQLFGMSFKGLSGPAMDTKYEQAKAAIEATAATDPVAATEQLRLLEQAYGENRGTPEPSLAEYFRIGANYLPGGGFFVDKPVAGSKARYAADNAPGPYGVLTKLLGR